MNESSSLLLFGAVADYSYPFIVIVVSMVTNAIHFSHFRHQVGRIITTFSHCTILFLLS